MINKSKRSGLMVSTTLYGALLSAATLAVAITALPTEVLAQSQAGSLQITITGKGGTPLAGAKVTVKSPDSLLTKSGTTDSAGRVRLAGLDPATNYTVTVEASGYNPYQATDVAVVSGRDLSLGYSLSEDIVEVVVTGRGFAALDVKSATVGSVLTLNTVESLPTGRSYQSYLQLVPGVLPSSGGNPASRSGINYSDIGGTIGSSSDNVYVIDGIDVTDPSSGTFGANFNSEIIQQQQVITGGVPAEYAGGTGLISKVVTKSGSNEWHGSVNYYLQNDSLVQKDKHGTSAGFSTYDTAVTLGGPIIKDKLWFFGSYQKKNRTDDVLNTTTGMVMRSVENTAEYGFGKLTWQINDDNRLTLTYFNDPTTISGSSVASTLNNRDTARVQGGDNYKVEYTGTFGDLILSAYAFRHKGELTTKAADQSIRDNVTYRTAQGATTAQRQLGGSGSNLASQRNRDEYGVTTEQFLDTSFGTHTIKSGLSYTDNVYAEDGSVPGNVVYASLAAMYSGTTYGTGTSYAATSGWTGRSFSSPSDDARILAAINANATAKASLDTNSNGTVSQAELNALVFSNTAGNPYSNVNVYRSLRTTNAPYQVNSKGISFFVQDTWTLNQLTVYAGIRAESWKHYDSTGVVSAKFDWEVAPRLSVTYDVFGDGRSKVFAYAGRYYDPIRNNMSDFAGALTGPVDEEQINVNGTWVTFRTRGGATTPDALFSPTTKTPYTDEFMVGGATTFGTNIGLSATIVKRQTRDILEDFDLTLYSDPTLTQATAPDGYAYPGSLFYLPYSYFGYTSKPNSNYVLGTLPGGKRDYWGFETVLTKYKTKDSNWFGQVSYTYNDAKGNTNSDSNADYQGDWIALDPRAPNAYGRQPGSIKHLFKAYGAYDFDFGLQVSSVFNWNSGSYYTPAEITGGRYFAPMSDPYRFGGVVDSYYKPNGIGSQKNPSYYTLDVRFKYEYDLPVGKTEVFLDLFNILDKQSTTTVMPVLAGNGTYKYQEGTAWVAPRRAYLGIRYAF